MAGCTEGTIRNYEILGRAPWQAKEMLYQRQVSMRRLVQLVREATDNPGRPNVADSPGGHGCNVRSPATGTKARICTSIGNVLVG
jgi:hypothetical protein